MKKSNFCFLTLCILLIIASVNGMSTLLRIALVANAAVMLMEIVKTIHGFKANRR